MPRIVLVACCLSAVYAHAAGPDFNRQVRPILARHCLKCHGPDETAREAGLRLDVREAATQPIDSGKAAIVPGKPEESELLRRIFANDEAERMPPAHTKDVLSDSEKETLRQWIAAGAAYEPHWAFQPIRRPPLPPVQQADWTRNPIDYFVLARLEQHGMAPSPEADKYTLVRRVYLDLIGLPPTPDEADAFVRDEAPDAYERLVDRLLASPHYGERWARRWLDLARYADTNGYEKDRPRSIWPYRDWVINALNADMPFDQFTVEQLAGDMLPDATLSQRIATGLHRNTMINEEGGIDPLEYRFYAMVDRVATTGAIWLGLTLGCAQCHTHKFDPVSQREYYQLMALLNNADEPEIEVPLPELLAKRREVEARIEAMEKSLARKFPVDPPSVGDRRSLAERRREAVLRKYRDWLTAERAKAVRWTSLRPSAATSNLPLLTILDDDSVFSTGDLTKRDVYTLTFRGPITNLHALRLEAMADERLPKRGPGRTYYEGPLGDFVLSELTVTADGKPVKLASATQSFANGKHTAATSIDGDPATGWSINGAQGRSHHAVFTLERPLERAEQLQIEMVFEKHYSAALGRFRFSMTEQIPPADSARHPVDIEALLLIPRSQRTIPQRQRLFNYFLAVTPELAPARKEIEELRKELPALPTTLVLQERPPENPRPTFMHKRGEFLQPTGQVEPDTPAFLPPMPEGAPRDRLAFARWLVDPANPLVARVTVNRQWAALFGRGIVPTTDDFGYQGDPPSHRELLDWLAAEFMANDRDASSRAGWSLKRLHRLIVTSATYRQSSRVSKSQLAEDPQNVWLARGARFRLEAELIRDYALQASGLLSTKLGGPSVFPPQPAGVTSEGAYGPLAWNVSLGADRYRRSLYTFSKRTAPFAAYATFDAPSGEACVARREVSNTPLQALTLLNDEMFLEAAQALGAAAAALPGSDQQRASWLVRRVLVRPPQVEELKMVLDYVATQQARIAKGELNAAKVAGPGDGDAASRAAWTLAARALLNLDETITRE